MDQERLVGGGKKNRSYECWMRPMLSRLLMISFIHLRIMCSEENNDKYEDL